MVKNIRIVCSNGLNLPEKKVKKLHVKRTTANEISKKWGFQYSGTDSVYFIRCNAKGLINWDVAPVYRMGEILNHKNCVIL